MLGEEGPANIFTLQTRAQFGEIPSLATASETEGMLGAVAAAFAMPTEDLESLESKAKYKHVDYFCRCSKKGFVGHMASLPTEEIQANSKSCGQSSACLSGAAFAGFNSPGWC